MDYMAQALSLARLALGQVSPNPAVGAVVVKDDTIVGQGYTRPPGDAHAEVVALRQAGEAARGAALYVTLEPCCHFGRTPPCSRAIITAGIGEVHFAMTDPNPVVAGGGQRELQTQGIRTYTGEHESEARQLNEAYIKHITTRMPFVTVKFAASLDGKIATRSGDSRWISGVESRRYAHHLRYVSDAVMVGANTVLSDDPQLTVRCCGGKGGTVKKQPLRVIVDGKGRTPVTARVFQQPGKTLLVLGRPATPEERSAFNAASAELLELPLGEGQVDLKELFRVLGSRGITSVLVEGGGTLLGSLFDAALVDKVVAFIAPVIIGGEKAVTAVAGDGAAKIADSIQLKNMRVEQMGQDVVVSGYVGEQICLPA
ncbi:MAG: bifunctional diaminohydroxyphosphoribosylaminopyrimidine deaminase/5-amino-6-(5-phosphoribosylamino)uracil reductase RibD [Chloroflexi bacterium]|nr:bifunctional diaminohydroxyphosphoribosylaminopyrimidine deaminase/5-amino-6-(5-phosphoribosylamino)uracil reductase RibD [Chloroflexota bacterium]